MRPRFAITAWWVRSPADFTLCILKMLTTCVYPGVPDYLHVLTLQLSTLTRRWASLVEALTFSVHTRCERGVPVRSQYEHRSIQHVAPRLTLQATPLKSADLVVVVSGQIDGHFFSICILGLRVSVVVCSCSTLMSLVQCVTFDRTQLENLNLSHPPQR
jgi:hypothetical protein